MNILIFSHFSKDSESFYRDFIGNHKKFVAMEVSTLRKTEKKLINLTGRLIISLKAPAKDELLKMINY